MPNDIAPTHQKSPSEQTLEFTPLKRRLICLLYDAMLLISIQFVGFWLPQTVYAATTGTMVAPRWLLAHLCLLCLAYFAYCWCYSGQTLAMRTWKMRLVSCRERDTNGQVRYTRVTPLQAICRYFLAILGYSCGGISLIWALLDRQQQFLHDRLARTCIVQQSKSISVNTSTANPK